MISPSMLYALALLPFNLALVTLQYFTTGTKFPVAKGSLQKTLRCAMFAHVGPMIRVADAKHDAKPIDVMLKSMSIDLPGCNEPYTVADGRFTCNSWWLVNTITSKDSPILVFYHGGCMAMQIMDTHISALANLYKAYKQKYGVELSILLVDYTLTSSGATYPTQYNESNTVYDQLVSDNYTNIALCGDSAGANLSLNVLQYLQGEESSRKIVWPKAVVAISPYLNVYDKDSYRGSRKNHDGLDIFAYAMSQYFGAIYTGDADVLQNSSVVNIERNAHKVNWQDIPVIKDGNVLVLFGENEIVADETLRWCDKAGVATHHPENIVIEDKGIHIGLFLYETGFGETLDEWMEQFNAKTIMEFLHNKFD